MSDKFDELNRYNETTDVYLQLLWEAQKVEDKKLMHMIKQRLSDNSITLFPSVEGCEIIPFPRPFIPSIPFKEEPQLWPQQPSSHFYYIFCIYLLPIILYLVN